MSTDESGWVPVISQPTTLSGSPSPESLVRILEPAYGAVFSEPTVRIRGQAIPETVVSCNDEIGVADKTGIFTMDVPLTEGPNEIQCTASNLEGWEQDFSILVDYQP